MADFPTTDKNGVIPKVNPTVPEAEMTSKKTDKKLCSDSIHMRTKIKREVIRMEMKVRAMALTTVGVETLRSIRVTFPLPRMVVMMD